MKAVRVAEEYPLNRETRPMVRTVSGIVVASIVLYLFGFAWWGAGPYARTIWKQPSKPDAVGDALREHFPSNGTYFIPNDADMARNKERMERGPVAMLHVIALDGRPFPDPQVMAWGFVLNLAVIVVIALLLHVAKPALPTWRARVGLTFLGGLAAALLADVGDIVWWMLPAAWKLYVAGYHLLFWLIAGMVLGAFIRPTVSIPAAAIPR